MSVANLLTSATVIRDGDVLRSDWDGSPRFYCIRIYPQDPRECPSHPHLYTPRVLVRVELEGDPTAWHSEYCDDDADEINEAAGACVSEIEDMRGEQWDREDEAEKRDCLTSYEKGFGY